jgi:GMP synthase-like glutamine amidotransferase
MLLHLQCWKGEFPTVEDARSYDLILLSGSHYSSYEDLEWINRLKQLLPQYAEAGVKLFGSCFGCQVHCLAKNSSVQFV